MSSTRKPQARPGPAPERKAAAGPALTPQVLIVIYLVIAIIAGAVFFSSVVKKSDEKKQQLNSAITTADRNRDTYKKKKEMLPVANTLNGTVRDKLNEVTYMFMTDQSSMVPFWENDFFPILDQSRLVPTEDSKIKADVYTFHINMAMSPFDTLPASAIFDGAYKLFPIKYEGEKDGTPATEPINTQPADFLFPYNITLEKFGGDYEGVKKFVETLQKKSQRAFYTVHCIKNDDSKNVGTFRTQTEWTIELTVYFINPEASASGDAPPGAPGAAKC